MARAIYFLLVLVLVRLLRSLDEIRIITFCHCNNVFTLITYSGHLHILLDNKSLVGNVGTETNSPH